MEKKNVQRSEVEGDDLSPTDLHGQEFQDLDAHVEQQVSSAKGRDETNSLEEAAPESAGPSYSQQADQDLAGPSGAWSIPQASTLAQRRPSFLGTTQFAAAKASADCENIEASALVDAPDHSIGRDLSRTPSLASSPSLSLMLINVMEAVSTSHSVRNSMGPRHEQGLQTRSRTGDHTRIPTPFHSPDSSEEEVDDNSRGHPFVSENGDRVGRNIPHADRQRSVFGLSYNYIFSQVHRDARRCLSEVIITPFQRRCNKMRTIALSADSRLIMAIVEVIVKQINHRLAKLMQNRGASQAPSTSTGSQSRQFAKQMLQTVTTTINGHNLRHMALTRMSGTRTVFEVDRSLETEIGPLAVQVILTTITSIQQAQSGRQADCEAPAFSNATYFLAALASEVQSSLVQRPWPPRVSGSDLLHNQYRAKIIRAVEMKIAEMHGRSLWDWSLANRAFQLGPQQNTSSASDLVDFVLDDIQDTLEYLDYQALSRHQSPSCSTGIEDLDTDVMARDMVLKAANKLKESMSEFDLEGESSTFQVSSETSNYSSLSHSNTDLRTLCVRSAEAVRTILQTAKTELDSHSDESFDPCQRARDLLARLAAGVESIDDLEIDEMLQGHSEIMEPGTVSQHPDILSSAIYRSLLIQCPLAPSNMVQETVFLSHPVISQNVTAEMKKQQSSDIQTNRQLTEFFAEAKRNVTQVIQDAVLSMGVLTSHVTPSNIAEAATHVLESLLVDLNKAIEKNRTEGKRFWEQVKASLQTMYRTAVEQLRLIFTGRNHSDEQDHQDPCVTDVTIQDLEVPTNNDPTLAVSQESVRRSAKQILSNVLNVIAAGVTVSEHSSVDEQLINERRVATEMLDSILNQLRDDESDVNKEDHLREVTVSDTCQDVLPEITQVYMVLSTQDMLQDDVSAVTSVDDTVPGPERGLLPGPGTHGSCTSHGSSDLDKELVSELHANCPDPAFPPRCSLTGIPDAETSHVSSSRGKKKSQGWSFGCCLRFPTVRTKVFKNRVEPEILPAPTELPPQHFGTSRVALDHDRAILFSPKPEEDLPTEAAQKSRKRPLLVRAFQAICKAMSNPFKGCAFSKKN